MDHFYQFIHSTGGYTPRRSFLHLIWLCCIQVLWSERNHQLFSNDAKSVTQLMEKVKITSLSWLKVKNACFPFGYTCLKARVCVCLYIYIYIYIYKGDIPFSSDY